VSAAVIRQRRNALPQGSKRPIDRLGFGQTKTEGTASLRTLRSGEIHEKEPAAIHPRIARATPFVLFPASRPDSTSGFHLPPLDIKGKYRMRS